MRLLRLLLAALPIAGLTVGVTEIGDATAATPAAHSSPGRVVRDDLTGLKRQVARSERHHRMVAYRRHIAYMRHLRHVARLRELAAAREARAQAEAASRSVVRGPLSQRAHEWANTPFAQQVQGCESNHQYWEIDDNGGVIYYGAWQMNEDFVRTYGGVDPADYVAGGKFTMSEAQQDEIAYNGYLRRGWQPWACA